MAEQPELPTAWRPFAAKDAAPSTPKSLVAKLADVMAAVERIPKRGHNTHFNYDFATESDITAAIRKEMAARSLMMVPYVESLTWRTVPTKSGSNDVCCALVAFDIYDGESGAALKLRVAGEGQDSGDKCVPKALTSALKYALLKLFMIPTGDDPEHDGTKSARQARPPATATPAGEAHEHVQHPVPASAKATIPEGCALICDAQLGSWGKACGQVILIDHAGEEHKLAIFTPDVARKAKDACVSGALITPILATTKNGGKTYLKDLRREDIL